MAAFAIGQGLFLYDPDATSISKSIDPGGSLHSMPVLLSGMQFAGVKMGQHMGCPSSILLDSVFVLKLKFSDLTSRPTTSRTVKGMCTEFFFFLLQFMFNIILY